MTRFSSTAAYEAMSQRSKRRLRAAALVVLAVIWAVPGLLARPAMAAPAGTVVSWGWDSYGQVSRMPTGTGFTAVAAG